MISRPIETASYISSSPLIARTPRGIAVAWGGDALHVMTPEGREFHGWPRRGVKFFASSPSMGDVDGDGVPELFCGNDDHALYGWRLDGSPLAGFPIRTGGDIYSTPALADINGDGRREILFGSDDGRVYAVDGTGKVVPGWPVVTGHFVSASPTVCDMDCDGRPEVVIGSWDRHLYAWKHDGTPVPGWPVRLGHIIWSSATAADLDGDGMPEIIVASDLLYVFRADGTPQPGFPVPTRSWTVSSPCVADADGDGHLEIGVGSDRFYVFRANGEPAPGFPVDLGGYIWSSPIAVDIDGCGHLEWIVGSWDGTLHVIRHDGSLMPESSLRTGGPIYSSPAYFEGTDRCYLAVGSWDRTMYIMEGRSTNGTVSPKPMFQGNELRRGQVEIQKGEPLPYHSGVISARSGELDFGVPSITPSPPIPEEVIYVDVAVSDPALLSRAMIVYHVCGRTHPSPLVLHRERLRGMIHPLHPGNLCSWHIELDTWDGRRYRLPEEDEFHLQL